MSKSKDGPNSPEPAEEASHEAHAEPLAENDLGVVYGCDCGGINLSMGPMTLHLNADEAQSLWELMAQSLGHLGVASTPPSGKGSRASGHIH